MSNKNRLTSTGCVTLHDPMIKRHPGPYSMKVHRKLRWMTPYINTRSLLVITMADFLFSFKNRTSLKLLSKI